MAGKLPWFDASGGGFVEQVEAENKALVTAIREENKQALQAMGLQVNEIKKEQEVQKEQITSLRKDVSRVLTALDLLKSRLLFDKS